MHEPGRPPGIEAPGIFDGLRFGAIALGVVVDNLATLLVSVLLVAAFAAQRQSPAGGGPPDEAIQAIAASPEFLLASLLAGLACTVYGAYVGARRAGLSFARHGGWIGVGSAVVALALSAGSTPGEPRPPLWFELAGFLLVIPAGVLGGALAGLRSSRRAA